MNGFVGAFTGNAGVCRKGSGVAVPDLRGAYLQIHVHKSLWPFQTVMLL